MSKALKNCFGVGRRPWPGGAPHSFPGPPVGRGGSVTGEDPRGCDLPCADIRVGHGTHTVQPCAPRPSLCPEQSLPLSERPAPGTQAWGPQLPAADLAGLVLALSWDGWLLGTADLGEHACTLVPSFFQPWQPGAATPGGTVFSEKNLASTSLLLTCLF